METVVSEKRRSAPDRLISHTQVGLPEGLFLRFNGLLGPRNFTVVNFKQRPTTLTLYHATLAHALNVMGYYSLVSTVHVIYSRQSTFFHLNAEL